MDAPACTKQTTLHNISNQNQQKLKWNSFCIMVSQNINYSICKTRLFKTWYESKSAHHSVKTTEFANHIPRKQEWNWIFLQLSGKLLSISDSSKAEMKPNLPSTQSTYSSYSKKAENQWILICLQVIRQLWNLTGKSYFEKADMKLTTQWTTAESIFWESRIKSESGCLPLSQQLLNLASQNLRKQKWNWICLLISGSLQNQILQVLT